MTLVTKLFHKAEERKGVKELLQFGGSLICLSERILSYGYFLYKLQVEFPYFYDKHFVTKALRLIAHIMSF